MMPRMSAWRAPIPGDILSAVVDTEQTITGPDSALTVTSLGDRADEFSATGATLRPGAGAAIGPRPPHLEAELLERGAALGRYLVLDRLGAGGMGVVYTAYDPQLDRKVALKLVRNPKATYSSEGPTRLLREAQAMAKLAHPNVVTVHDVGIVDGQVFIAMEFVEGQTLGEWLAELGPAPGSGPGSGLGPRWVEVLDVFVAAGAGLRAAHEVGIVHRDFKPDNVLIGVDGRVRVMDFGLARADDDNPAVRQATGRQSALGPADDDNPAMPSDEGHELADSALGFTATTLTVAGAIMGTPAYMAPEQHLGLRADARADQFGFCVAMYEGLYGRRPFVGDNRHALALAVLEDQPAPAPKQTEVPAWLHAILLRGLATAADDRFESMAALLEAIAVARQPPRSRGGLILGLTVALGLAGALALGVSREQPRVAGPCDATATELDSTWGPERRAKVEQAFVRAGLAAEARASALAALDGYAGGWTAMRQDSCEATRVRASQSDELMDLRSQCLDRRRAELDALVDLLERGNPAALAKATLSVENLAPVQVCADLEQLRARVPLPEDPEARAALRRGEATLAEARAHVEAGLYADAALRIDTVEAEALAHAPLAGAVAALRGRVQVGRGEYVAAEASFAAASLAAAEGRDDRLRVEVAIELARLLGGHRSQPEQAALVDREAEVGIARIGGAPELDRRRRVTQALTKRNAGEPDEALKLLDAVRAELDQAGETETEFFTSVELMRASLIANLGRYEQARELLTRSIATLETRHGPDHPALITPLINLASMYVQNGEVEPSRATHTRVVALAEARLGPEHPDTAVAYESLGLFHYYVGDFASARTNLERAVRSYAANFDAGHPSLVRARGNYSAVLIELGEHDEAERVLIDSRDALVARFGRGHDYLAFLLINLAELYTAVERYDEARESIQWARTNAEGNFGHDNHRTAEAYSIEGQVEAAAGKIDAAIASLEAALDIYSRIEVPSGRLALAEAQLAAALVRTPERRNEGHKLFASATTRAASEAGAPSLAEVEALGTAAGLRAP
jgi:eukaryotic-like serine/threonine-protein kinase